MTNRYACRQSQPFLRSIARALIFGTSCLTWMGAGPMAFGAIAEAAQAPAEFHVDLESADSDSDTPVIADQDRLDQEVSVLLSSGRRFTAFVDAKTDDNRLWLRFQARSTKVLRPIDWDRVESVHVEGQDVAGDDFRAEVERYVAGEFDIWTRPEGPMPPGSGDHVHPWFGAAGTHADAASMILGTKPRVASIRAHAELGFWDGDVEADGLLVTLTPKSANGWLVPAGGTLEVTLYAPQDSKRAKHQAVRQIARWTVAVKADDFAAGTPTFKLPFQAVHPEFDLDVANFGMLNVRFSSPGSGTFETSDTTVRIREFSPVRDHLQRGGSSRFLPGEAVSGR